MGDDLTAARRFCDSVRSDMSALMEGVCAQPCAAEDVLLGSLVRIQSGAKRLHARAIFRAAQTVVNAVNDSAPLPTVQGRILSLNKLVVQYEGGLDDIAPRPANAEHDIQEPVDSPLVFADAEPPMPDIEARFRAARAALLPLMSFAQTGADREALARLAKFSDNEIDAQKDIQEADITLETLSEAIEPLKLELEDVSSLETQSSSLPPKSEARSSYAGRPTDFESLMPSFISHALQEARLTEKTVSVSYGADGVSVAQANAPALQSLLEHIAQTLVRSVVERPETRRARGQSGAGHIAVTATQSPKTLTVSIECPGAPLAISAFRSAALNVPGLTITPGANAHDQLTHIVLTLPRKAAAGSPAKVSEIAS